MAGIRYDGQVQRCTLGWDVLEEQYMKWNDMVRVEHLSMLTCAVLDRSSMGIVCKHDGTMRRI